jgi:divinyl protochlorophyllide a 8-vinyl-reductase
MTASSVKTGLHQAPNAGSASGRIGPNSITQTLRALDELTPGNRARVWAASALTDAAPTAMVPEAWFMMLVRAVRQQLPAEQAEAVLRWSGSLTADYVRANRIPAPAKLILSVLPRAWALPLLLWAVGKHAWTFAGSGTFRVEGHTLVLDGSPTARAQPRGLSCSYYEAAFEGLLSLAAPGVQVRERCCRGAGAPDCRFELTT